MLENWSYDILQNLFWHTKHFGTAGTKVFIENFITQFFLIWYEKPINNKTDFPNYYLYRKFVWRWCQRCIYSFLMALFLFDLDRLFSHILIVVILQAHYDSYLGGLKFSLHKIFNKIEPRHTIQCSLHSKSSYYAAVLSLYQYLIILRRTNSWYKLSLLY